ncbi:MAG: UDP-N-acetylglucosamine 2-epimerase, partial [Planctomycetota bacterium]
SQELRLIFPRHPRTKAMMEKHGITLPDSITVTDPLPYLENLNLVMDAKVVLSDSGGLQEETTALGVPCLTMRENTERPVTLHEGTSDLVGNDPEKIRTHFRLVMEGKGKAGRIPNQWDGKAAERIVEILDRWFAE